MRCRRRQRCPKTGAKPGMARSLTIGPGRASPPGGRHKKRINFRTVNARPLVLVAARWSPRRNRGRGAARPPLVAASLPCAHLGLGRQLTAAHAREFAPGLAWGTAQRPHSHRAARAQGHERQCAPLAVAPSNSARAPARPAGPAAHVSAWAEAWQRGGRKMATAAAMRAEHRGVRGAACLRETW